MEAQERREVDFLKACSEAGKRISEMRNAIVVHHFDADGIPAGAIVFSGMYRAGNAPSMRCWKKTTPENLAALRDSQFKQVIFTDLGAGYVSELAKYLGDKEVIVLDHHEPEKPLSETPANITVVNPHHYGIDGSIEVAGGGVAYLCFRQHRELAQLAIVSAVGDIQDKNGLVGLNKLILQDAVEQQDIEVKKELKIFGRSARSLISFLVYCTEPVLPGLTGNDKNCARFLYERGIPLKRGDKYLTYFELTENERKQLASCLIEYALEKKVPEKLIEKMIGDVYTFPNEDKSTPFYDSHEYAGVMNACGRNNAGQVGVNACLKDPTARQHALELLNQHRQNLKRGITLSRNKVSDAGAFYLLDCRGQVRDAIIGTVASAVLNSGELKQTKPIIALSNDDEDQEMAKISTRATQELVEKGVNLNEMLRLATQELGKSYGGGHNIAAGASVEKQHLPEFLKRCADVLKEQLGEKL